MMIDFHLHVARRLRQYKWHFLFQMLGAVLSVYLVLLSFKFLSQNLILSGIGLCSLCATIFIIFVTPDAKVATTKRIIGGYIIAIVSGVVCHVMFPTINHQIFHSSPLNVHLIAGAVAVTITMFLMAIFDLDHPPASGFTLGLALTDWASGIFFIVGIAVFILVSIKILFRKYLVSFI